MVLGSSRWVLRLALLTEGALLLFGVAQIPVFSVNWCQDFISAALVVQLSFRMPGRSINSVSWVAPDSGSSTKGFPPCWLFAVMECAQGELWKQLLRAFTVNAVTATAQTGAAASVSVLSLLIFPRQLPSQAISQRHSVLLPQPPSPRPRPLWFSPSLPLFHPFILSWCLPQTELLFPT